MNLAIYNITPPIKSRNNTVEHNWIDTLSVFFFDKVIPAIIYIVSTVVFALFLCISYIVEVLAHNIDVVTSYYWTWIDSLMLLEPGFDWVFYGFDILFSTNCAYFHLAVCFIMILILPSDSTWNIFKKRFWFFVTMFTFLISIINLMYVNWYQIDQNKEAFPILLKSLGSTLTTISYDTFDDDYLRMPTLEEEFAVYLIQASRKIGLVFCALVAYIFILCAYVKQTVCTKVEMLLYIALEFCLLKAFNTLNLLEFYIYFEAVLIPMYLLIIGWGSGEAKKGLAAYYLVFYTIFFSIPLLAAILYLGHLGGSYNLLVLKELKLTPNDEFYIMVALFVGFAVKVPVVPFHTWLPEAHVNASTTASVILASLLLKLGSYGMAVFLLNICSNSYKYYLPAIHGFLIVSIVYSSMVAIVQTDLKRIIAYSSIGHMNLGLLGVFCNNSEGFAGSIFLMVSHGLVSAGLFFSVGFVYDRYRTRDITYYGGLAGTMPLFSIMFFIFSLANMGFPGTSAFVGELLVLVGTFKHNTVIAVLALSGAFLSTIYSVWTYNRVCFGTPNVT
jgi:NADH-quinone oxidoreductase subunit M